MRTILWTNISLHIPGRTVHSTKTTLVRFVSDMLRAADEGKAGWLLLPDLSAALDTVEHGKLLECLQSETGITDIPLLWLASYLTDISVCCY